MNYSQLPKRVFNSPLIEYANFSDNTHINLIRLNKPYADGSCYAVVNTTKYGYYASSMFRSFKAAKENFNFAIFNNAKYADLISTGITGNQP